MTQSTRLNQEQWQSKIREAIGLPIPFANKYEYWFNSINKNSLRLTPEYYLFINKHATNLKFYMVTLADPILPKQLLQLERLFTAPYFIRQLKKIFVLDETTYIMLQLHDGNLNTYLQNLEDNQ